MEDEHALGLERVMQPWGYSFLGDSVGKSDGLWGYGFLMMELKQFQPAAVFGE